MTSDDYDLDETPEPPSEPEDAGICDKCGGSSYQLWGGCPCESK